MTQERMLQGYREAEAIAARVEVAANAAAAALGITRAQFDADCDRIRYRLWLSEAR
jgi:hypothetical protein